MAFFLGLADNVIRVNLENGNDQLNSVKPSDAYMRQ